MLKTGLKSCLFDRKTSKLELMFKHFLIDKSTHLTNKKKSKQVGSHSKLKESIESILNKTKDTEKENSKNNLSSSKKFKLFGTTEEK